MVPFGDALVSAGTPLVWGALVAGVPIVAIALLALGRRKQGETLWAAALRGLINRVRMILRTPDPTSLEFESLFRSIVIDVET